MSRQPRIHVPEGTYYVVRQVDSDPMVALRPEDYALFETLLPSALKHTGNRLLGYCWMPNALHFVLQTSTSPIGNLVRDVTSHFSQHLHRQTGQRRPYFRHRHQQMLIDPDKYLARIVHYIHYLPVCADLIHEAIDYPWSSHQAYLGRVRCPWLDMKPVLRRMGAADDGKMAFRRLLTQTPPGEFRDLFRRPGTGIPAILGDAEFIASLAHQSRSSRTRWSLPEIAAYVAQVHSISLDDLRSRSRRHTLVVARARVGWFATERRVASLTDVARYLNHSSSGLTRAITRCKHRHPELFTLRSFRALEPPLSLTGGSHDQREKNKTVGNSLFGTGSSPQRLTLR